MSKVIDTPQRGLSWQSGEALTLMQDMVQAITELQLEVDVLRKQLVKEDRGLVLRVGWLLTATAVTTEALDTNSNPTKWTYEIQRAVEDTVEGQWKAFEGNPTITAYNLVEVMNTGISIQGNGVDHDGAAYPAGFAMKPAPVLRPYKYFTRMIDGVPIAFFEHENAEDGDCPA